MREKREEEEGGKRREGSARKEREEIYETIEAMHGLINSAHTQTAPRGVRQVDCIKLIVQWSK